MDYGLSESAYILDRSAYTDWLLVDNFEDGNTVGWDMYDYPSDRWDVNADAALDGSALGLWMTSGNFLEAHAHPGKADTLPNYPEPGMTIRFRFRMHNWDTVGSPQWRFNFAMSGADDSQDEYELQIQEAGSLRLQRDDSSTTGKDDVVADYGVTWSLDTEYEITIEWDRPENSEDFVITCRDVDAGSTLTTLSGNDDLGSMYTGPGITLWKNGDLGLHFDELYLIP